MWDLRGYWTITINNSLRRSSPILINRNIASMAFVQRPTARLLASARPRQSFLHPKCSPRTRHIFNFFRKSKPQGKQDPIPVLTQDNLFHPFSKSPFPAIRARGQAIQLLAPCSVCASTHSHVHAHVHASPRAVQYECPDCGWPTHCSEEHWKEDEEHQKYCSRLREANEDEHDLRSGRRLREFELPGSFLTCILGIVQYNLSPQRPPRL